MGDDNNKGTQACVVCVCVCVCERERERERERSFIDNHKVTEGR
jgi:hypothetical protein